MRWQSARGYCWARAMRLLGERPLVTLLAVSLAAIALAVPVCIFMFAQALGPATLGAPVAEFSVFVTPAAAAGDLKTVATRLAALQGVAATRIVSREQAWSDLQRRWKDAPPMPEARLGALPDIIVVTFPSSTVPGVVEAAAAAAAKLPRVESVQADLDWYRRLWSLADAARQAVWPGVVVGALLLAALILGTVRAATRVEGRELRVLADIGADRDFVRRPQVYAGAVVLGLAAAACLGIVAGVRLFAGPRMVELGRAWGLELTLSFPPWPLIVAFVAACVLTGAVAALHFAGRALAQSMPSGSLH